PSSAWPSIGTPWPCSDGPDCAEAGSGARLCMVRQVCPAAAEGGAGTFGEGGSTGGWRTKDQSGAYQSVRTPCGRNGGSIHGHGLPDPQRVVRAADDLTGTPCAPVGDRSQGRDPGDRRGAGLPLGAAGDAVSVGDPA